MVRRSSTNRGCFRQAEERTSRDPSIEDIRVRRRTHIASLRVLRVILVLFKTPSTSKKIIGKDSAPSVNPVSGDGVRLRVVDDDMLSVDGARLPKNGSSSFSEFVSLDLLRIYCNT